MENLHVAVPTLSGRHITVHISIPRPRIVIVKCVNADALLLQDQCELICPAIGYAARSPWPSRYILSLPRSNPELDPRLLEARFHPKQHPPISPFPTHSAALKSPGFRTLTLRDIDYIHPYEPSHLLLQRLSFRSTRFGPLEKRTVYAYDGNVYYDSRLRPIDATPVAVCPSELSA